MRSRCYAVHVLKRPIWGRRREEGSCSMEIVFQTMANGLLVGALYGLVAVGFALLMGVMKFLNTAHGTFIILGGYLSFWLLEIWGIDPFLSLPLVVMAMFLIG